MSSLGFCAALGLAIATVSAAAQPADRTKFWKSVQKKCDETASTEISPLATAIAQAAKTEHKLWEGHKIDHTGRLYQFGLVESEHLETSKEDAKLHDVGWWNVWRYWQFVMTFDEPYLKNKRIEKRTLDRLPVYSVDKGLAATDATLDLHEKEKSIRSLLDTIDKVDDKILDADIKQSLKQSVIRSFVVDNPWSAAFISYVVGRAIKAPDTALKFFPSAEHRSYINEAFESSKVEYNKGATHAAYRACPIYKTRPRVGDLICYQRERYCAGVDPMAVANRFAHGDALPKNNTTGDPEEDCVRISATHCDVVTDIDKTTNKLHSIGGNVQQSVTERRLRLAPPTLALSNNLGEKDCRRDQAKDAVPANKRCSLNNKDWFVLLQLRDGKPKVAGKN